MKTCKLCGKVHDYTQRYCQACWPGYLKARRQANKHDHLDDVKTLMALRGKTVDENGKIVPL